LGIDNHNLEGTERSCDRSDEEGDESLADSDEEDLTDFDETFSIDDDAQLETDEHLEEEFKEPEEKDFLNESTADFNKAIKQINQQLKMEGHLEANDIIESIENKFGSHQKSLELKSKVQHLYSIGKKSSARAREVSDK